MKQIFQIKNKEIISKLLNTVKYGTLAICNENRPYSLPINFAKLNDEICFHGSKKGKKIDIIKNNQFASFSVVEPYSIISSYFRSKNKLACSTTHFFKSVIIDGKLEFVNDYDKKVDILSAMMNKFQPEGKYIPLNKDIYHKIIDALAIFKLVPTEINAKFKFGQNLNKEQFNMIIEYLIERGDEKDMQTIKMMQEFLPI